MSNWRIYYSNSTIDGNTEEDWNAAPDDNIQIIVVYEPYPDPAYRPWSGLEHIQVYTGTDEYSINGWKTKYGKLLPDDLYYPLWEEMLNAQSSNDIR